MTPLSSQTTATIQTNREQRDRGDDEVDDGSARFIMSPWPPGMQQQRGSSYIEPKTKPKHRLPRPYLNNPKAMSNPAHASSNSEDERASPMLRTPRSSYSTDLDRRVDAEHSILVSKMPSHGRPGEGSNPGHTSSRSHTHHMQEATMTATKKVTIASTGAQPPSRGSSSYIGGSQDKLAPMTAAERVTRQIYSSVNPHTKINASNTTTTTTTSGNPLSHRLPPSELESNLSRLRPSDLITAYLSLAEQLRRSERQSELREELLRRTQNEVDSKDRAVREREVVIRRMERDMAKIQEEDEEEGEQGPDTSSVITSASSTLSGAVRCRHSASGCPYRLPSMEYHEERKCRFRPTRCPSLTCLSRPALANLLTHIEDEHDGTIKGKDRICRNGTNHLVSSYVNIDDEPIFYKNTRMTWVANELTFDGRHFYLECMRNPPDWHLWVYILGSEREAETFQATITLFREDEFGRVGDAGYTAQRSYTGHVISIHRSKEEIAELSLGFQVHDKQIRSLCGPISGQEEQLFGYEVTVYRK